MPAKPSEAALRLPAPGLELSAPVWTVAARRACVNEKGLKPHTRTATSVRPEENGPRKEDDAERCAEDDAERCAEDDAEGCAESGDGRCAAESGAGRRAKSGAGRCAEGDAESCAERDTEGCAESDAERCAENGTGSCADRGDQSCTASDAPQTRPRKHQRGREGEHEQHEQHEHIMDTGAGDNDTSMNDADDWAKSTNHITLNQGGGWNSLEEEERTITRWADPFG